MRCTHINNEKSLKDKTIAGMLWSFVGTVGNNGFQLIIQIVLARLLLPEDFGVIGMVVVFTSLAQVFIDSGFTQGLIREKEPTDIDYSTVFYFNLIVSIIIYVLLFFARRVISSFFNEPLLLQILPVLTLVLIIDAIGLIPRTILVRQLNFQVQAKISMTSAVISGVMGILLAYIGFGVWSLVIRLLIMQLCQATLYILANRWKPMLTFSIDSFRSLFKFGSKLLISSLFTAIYDDIYYVVIGRSFSVVSLGFYTKSRGLRDGLLNTITSSIQNVSYPVLSQMKESASSLKSGYKKILKMSAYIVFPLMTGLVAIAPNFIEVFLGENWLDIIPFFQILCIAGMLYPVHAINLNVLKVKGRSDLYLRVNILKKIVGLVSIVVVLYYNLGMIGLMWATVTTSYISLLINTYYTKQMIDYSIMNQLEDMYPSFLLAVIMGFTVYYSTDLFVLNQILELILQVVIGAMIYIAASVIFKMNELIVIFEIIMNNTLKLKKEAR